MMHNYVYFWLALLILFIVVEVLTVGLASIWFAAGALVAMFAAAAGVRVLWQCVTFLIVSAVLLFFTRPLAKKYINARHEKTNYEKKIGETVKITQRVDNKAQTGAALADGIEWTARSLVDDEVLEEGTLAKVVSVKGVKLILTKRKEEQDGTIV